MCQLQGEATKLSPSKQDNDDDNKPPFPWHVGVYDAHCHPTDTMPNTSKIKTSMRAIALTVMATRSQDQDLVLDLASEYKLNSKDDLRPNSPTVVIPAFGWHPWFSHQIYDDRDVEKMSHTYNTDENTNEAAAKSKHYDSVLQPSPKDDTDFLESLPTPTALSTLLNSIQSHLSSHPHALIGEIGLDKAFRLPAPPSPNAEPTPGLTPGGREGRALSPYRVRPQHQQTILEAQLQLAGQLGRAVSVHGVQGHGLLLDTVARCWKGNEKEVLSRRQRRLVERGKNAPPHPEDNDEGDQVDKPDGSAAAVNGPSTSYPPRICLHSFSASVDVLKQWLDPTIPATIYFSFSIAVNAGTSAAREKVAQVIKVVPEDKILVESDLHTAGPEMDAMLEEICRLVCDVKGWALEDGVERLGRNFKDFIFGKS